MFLSRMNDMAQRANLLAGGFPFGVAAGHDMNYARRGCAG